VSACQPSEQVRLCLDKKDYIRAQILSRKINPRSFDEIVKQEKKAGLDTERHNEAKETLADDA
jgi:26S proteasome regulatory subunit N5